MMTLTKPLIMRPRLLLILITIIIIIVVVILTAGLLASLRSNPSTSKPRSMTENVTVGNKDSKSTGKSSECRARSGSGGKYGSKKNENECRRVVEARYGVQFPTIRPDWLPSPHPNKNGKRRNLELDCYNPMNRSLRYDDSSSVGLAIEYDGIQHREPGHFGMTQEDFDKAVERDRHKDKLCKRLGITLIRVSDLVKFKDIESYLNKELDRFDAQQQRQRRRICVIC